MAAKHWLSKSTFIRGLQCQKSFYLYKNHYDWRDAPDKQRQFIFESGNQVGKLATDLFAGGELMLPKGSYNYQLAVDNTKKAIETHNVIYEAAFMHKGVIVLLDILVKTNQGWVAYEVKSSTHVSDTYKRDAALQYWVINGAELPLADFNILHLNADYVRQGTLDLEALFTTTSVFDFVKEQGQWVSTEIDKLKQVTKLTEIPNVDIGPQCDYPYPCDFKGTCWTNIKDKTLLELPYLKPEDKFGLFRQGLTDATKVPKDLLNGITENTHKQLLKGELVTENVCFELPANTDFYALHLLTNRQAVPPFTGLRPWEEKPFGFALGYYKADTGEIKTIGKYYNPDQNNQAEITAQLAQMLSRQVPIVVWQADSLVKCFYSTPNKLNLTNRIVELSKLFTSGSVKHMRMFGYPSLSDLCNHLYDFMPDNAPVTDDFLLADLIKYAYPPYNNQQNKHKVNSWANMYLKSLVLTLIQFSKRMQAVA